MSLLEDAPAEQPRPADEAPSMGFFASEPMGKVVVSMLCAFIVFALVIWNLPPRSHIRTELRGSPLLTYPMRAAAIDQNWGVFSPNPTTTSLRVEADVTLANGQVIHHTFPDGDWFVGGLSEYRWRKWERRVRLDSNSSLWNGTAEWVAGQYQDVVEVTLIRYFSETPVPGSGQPREWNSFEFFTLEITE